MTTGGYTVLVHAHDAAYFYMYTVCLFILFRRNSALSMQLLFRNVCLKENLESKCMFVVHCAMYNSVHSQDYNPN
jgi:hypothetical protein